MGAWQAVLILYGLAYQVIAAPSPKPDDTPSGIPPLLTFKDGNIGVNFLGFKASAGLGGLLTGDMSQGGLHAEAETPFGQKAGAGLGGRVDGEGRSIGGLYAGATAGGGVGAAAGLDGVAGADGSAGRSYAGASAGGVGKTVVKETYGAPQVGGSVNIQKVSSHPSSVDVEVIKEKTVHKPHVSESKVSIQFEKEVAAPPPPPVKKTFVERTVIPNYVEKTIQVPSYVEKTIRVPTVVEKTIKVPAPPTIIEKEVEVPQPVKTVTKTKQVIVDQEVPTGTIVKTRTKIHRRPWLHVRKYINLNGGIPPPPPFYGGVVAGGNAEVSTNSVVGGYGDFGFGKTVENQYCCGPPPVAATYTVRKQFNGNLIRDIFNIPISTLGAVSNLVGNIAGGTSGSVSVSKSVGTY